MNACMTGKIVSVMLALLVSVLTPGVGTAGEAIVVTVNKSVLLPEMADLAEPFVRVSITAPDIAKLVPISPTQLRIDGMRTGSTTLIVWKKGIPETYDITVVRDLQSWIHEIAPNDSITVNYANDVLVLAGKATNDQTIAKVLQIAEAYAGRKGKNPDHGVGSPAKPQTGEASDKKRSIDDMPRVLNHIQVDEPQQVLLEVKVAQVDKAALSSLGVSAFVKGASAEGFSNQVGSPSGDISTQGIKNPGIAGSTQFLGAIDNTDRFQLGFSVFKPGIGAVLKALVTKNMAKVLAEPNLLVKSGQTGTFLAGSKVPITILSSAGGTSAPSIEFITIGVKLNFKPEVLENGLISLKIDPAEVSSIAGTLAVNGYPIIDTREIRTNVQLKDGESLILAGLLQEETIKTMSKVPLLGDIPILGALFRSTQDDRKEKELVFFITPKIVKPDSSGRKPKLLTDKPLTPDQEKELQWMPLQ
jgi:pilus assembly protein CpaC